MLDSGLATITMFFVIIGISLIFVVTWILKSESRVNVCKDEIKKLKNDLDASERERFVLSEKVAKKNLKPVHIIDLCKMAIGEKEREVR